MDTPALSCFNVTTPQNQLHKEMVSQDGDLNPIQLLWDDLEGRLSRPDRPTSAPELTNALVAEGEQQVPAAKSGGS